MSGVDGSRPGDGSPWSNAADPLTPQTLPARASVFTRFAPSRPIVRILLFAIGVRLLTAGLAFFLNVVLPMHQREQFTMGERTNLFWDPFVRWDSGWYFGIARHGYAWTPGGRSNLAFFPVYPMLMRYVGLALGGGQVNVYRAGILASWSAFLLATVMLYRLARLDLPPRLAERAVVYFSLWPFAFFYGIVYSESVFVLAAITAVYLFRTAHWEAAGVIGGLAALTRVNGIMALPAFAWMAWRSAGHPPERRRRAALGVAIVAALFACYPIYVYTLSGSPVEWMASIRRWDYTPGGAPWSAIVHVFGSLATRPYEYLSTDAGAPYDVLHGLASLIFVCAVPFVWRKFGAGYGLYMLANLWLPLSSGKLEGMGRYCAVLFPFFIWLASTRSRALHAAVLPVFVALYVVCLAMFTKVYPLY